MVKINGERAKFLRLMLAVLVAGSLVAALPAAAMGLTCVTTGNVTEVIVGGSGTVEVWLKNIESDPADCSAYAVTVDFDLSKVDRKSVV